MVYAVVVPSDIESYNHKQADVRKVICEKLAAEIVEGLPEAENKVWHGHPVWFIDGNPTVGYSVNQNKQAGSYVRLMFWSGADFDETNLVSGTGKFKDAHIDYTAPNQIVAEDVQRWLEKSKKIQWDYKNIVKRKGKLERLS